MDPLKYIFQKPMPTGKLAKWQIFLSEFNNIYVTQRAVKGQALADHLAENPVHGEYEPLKMYFPDEEVSFVGEDITEAYDGWRMFFDGAANFKGVGIGAVLRFTKIEFKHVPRIQNKFSYALATLSSMIQHPNKNFIDPIPIGIHKQPVYYAHVEEESDGNPWFHDIKEYLAKGEYPEHATHIQKRTLRRLANHFFQSGGILYRRTADLGLLQCVDAKEASRLLKEIHAGTCGPHMNGFVLAKKILRAGYFWMTMETDCIRYVQKRHQYQIHADMIRVPPNELNATSASWPFSVEAASYKAVTKKVVAGFVRDCIVCRFGVPESIITDNVTTLNSDLMKAMCETFMIKHKNSTAYRPQMNGDVEAANKNIKKILRKMVDNYKQWHEKLPFALLGYCTMIRTSTGATLYLLVYRTEVVIPTEVEIPCLRIIQEVALSDAEWV
ncbi:uncharacterized protein [Nicotiana tomentosiformis]|uniref:uncharacterized protein n=1 Tax=Nicotiana tomentosiformis TaxID=4098 RepID=UPI00388C7CD8